MFEILSAYKEHESKDSLFEAVATFLKNKIKCEAISIFDYIDINQSVELIYSTSTGLFKFNRMFEKESSIVSMLESGKDEIVHSKNVDQEYYKSDVFFEDIKYLHCIAYARVFD